LLTEACDFPAIGEAGGARIVPCDPQAMGDALVEMLRDPLRLRQMGRRAREFVLRNYAWDKIGQEFITVFAGAMERRA